MAASCLRPLLLALLLAGACPASAADPGEIVLGARCREEWTKYLAQPNPGFFYYAEDPASGKHQCGASASDGFDRYPSRQQEAFTACQNAADEAGIAARCRLMARGPRVGARTYGEAAPAEEFITDPGLRCGQTPRDRFFWTEAAFCDTTLHGSERAAGLVIWNHGVMGKEVQHATLVPPAFRLLQARGWDVIRLNRHNLAEDQDSLGRASVRLLEEVAAQRKRGYQRVVVAGQSFGGFLSLETATRSRDIFAAVAFAPGLRSRSRAESFDSRPVTWRLPSLVVERVAVVFPAQDALFDNAIRGPEAEKALTRRGMPFWLVDATGGLTGHGGATGGVFALRYGMCLVEFLTASQIPGGRFECRPPADEWAVARELLPQSPPSWPLIADAGELPEALQGLTGVWYGLLHETNEILLFFLSRSSRGELRALVGVTGRGRSGGIHKPTLGESGVRLVYSSKATVTVTSKGPDAAEFVYTSSDGARTYRASLRHAGSR
ncbi:MAG: hypothetical protein HY002_09735 [Candidatus Rokubacteria bacterium]|nr:hypothetical protein [Candidatus Rokubacteria bacterium]